MLPSRPPWRRRAGVAALVSLAACGGGAPAPREDVPPPVATSPLLATLVVVGDTIAHGMDPAEDPLTGVADLLAGADALVLNHEGVLAAHPLPQACAAAPRQTLLDAHPGSAAHYARAPHVVVTLANNHALDCGDGGLAATIATLDAQGFTTLGAGADLLEACAGRRLRVGALDVAFHAYLAMDAPHLAAGEDSAGAATWGPCGGAADVAAARADGAFVLVALHMHLYGGWTRDAPPAHVTQARAALHAGADLVVGHGSHVPQGVLVDDGRVALLSLGNFLFAHDRPLSDLAREVLVVHVAVHERELLLTFAPARLDAAGRPQPASPDDAARILDALDLASRPHGTSLVRRGDRAHLLVLRVSP
jgi:poly-gamma-glutamate capsule biosynthesis protein CapA/YwtB (metallophosphatase superfamily)